MYIDIFIYFASNQPHTSIVLAMNHKMTLFTRHSVAGGLSCPLLFDRTFNLNLLSLILISQFNPIGDRPNATQSHIYRVKWVGYCVAACAHLSYHPCFLVGWLAVQIALVGRWNKTTNYIFCLVLRNSTIKQFYSWHYSLTSITTIAWPPPFDYISILFSIQSFLLLVALTLKFEYKLKGFLNTTCWNVTVFYIKDR